MPTLLADTMLNGAGHQALTLINKKKTNVSVKLVMDEILIPQSNLC